MNVHKKTIMTSAFIFILSIIIIISVHTYCESNNAVLYGNNIEIPINQEGIFYINVSGIDDLAFLTIDITWDPSVLTVSEVNDTISDFDIVFSDIHENQGKIDIDAYSFDEPLHGDNIVVCSLICEATDNADVGDSCDVLFENSILWNSTGNEVEHISQSAIVNITEDVSGNVIVVIDDEKLTVNEDGLAYINISGVEKLAFVTMEVVWDPSVIKVTEVNDTVSDFDLVFSNVNTNDGHLAVQAYRFDEVGISGNVVVCGIAIEPADQAIVGDTTTMNINKSILWNISIDSLDHVKNNGTISIVDAEASNAQDVNLYANEINMPLDKSGLVHVNLSTLGYIGYLSLNISWDPLVVQLESVNDTFSDFNMVYSYPSDDYIHIDAYSLPTPLSGDKIICGLLFSAADGSSVNDVSAISFTDVSVSDNNTNPLLFTLEDGSITLAEATNDEGNDDDNNNGGSTGGGSTGGSGGGGGAPPVIVENTDPVAVIEVSSKVEYIDTSISFDASKSSDEDGDTLTYHWDFGDGSESTEMKTTHSFSSADVYLVTLTVDDGQGGSDTETVDISINPPGNNPPSQLVVTEDTTTAHKNTDVTFTAVAVDEDENDTIHYVFDWDDGTEKTVSEYMNSSVTYNTMHQWAAYGKYTVKVIAEDNENARSETVRITMLIDIKEISGEIDGWLIDENSDGIYDSYKNLDTNEISSIENVNESYCRIDTDNDSNWDYEINLETNVLTPYSEKKSDTTDDSGILYLLGLVIIVFIVLIVLLNRKKPSVPEEKSESKKESKKSKK